MLSDENSWDRSLCWIRRDLRLNDHSALAAATRSSKRVAVVFVFDSQILDKLEDRDDRRVTFIHRSLEELDGQLRAQGSRLIVLHGDPVEEIPRLAAQLGCQAVYTARDNDPYAISRDAAISAALKLITVKDTVIFEGGEVLNQTGLPFRVFTPYSRAWRARVTPADYAEQSPDLGRLWPADDLNHTSSLSDWPLERIGFTAGQLPCEPGASGAEAALQQFAAKITGYGNDRDFPAKAGTSEISVHLRFGTCSIRQAIRLAVAGDSYGHQKWLAELIWREFYQDILSNFPQVVTEPFQPQYRDIEYPGPVGAGEDKAWEAWCIGQTGFPIVDAAMRCLNQTGKMHNRLRMVCASFLTKDLLIDYRRGEAYFARKLLDFDLASNNGGWQWSSSVGADAQPYFRVFNPLLQSKKFDPEGVFIRTWVPELAELSDAALHAPAEAPFECLEKGIELGKTYPFPIVNHAQAKDAAVHLLSSYAKPEN